MWVNLQREILEDFASFKAREYFEGMIVFRRKRLGLAKTAKTDAQRARDWEKRNRSIVRARLRGVYARDPERAKARVKAWKMKNRARVNEAARRRAAAKRTGQ